MTAPMDIEDPRLGVLYLLHQLLKRRRPTANLNNIESEIEIGHTAIAIIMQPMIPIPVDMAIMIVPSQTSRESIVHPKTIAIMTGRSSNESQKMGIRNLATKMIPCCASYSGLSRRVSNVYSQLLRIESNHGRSALG